MVRHLGGRDHILLDEAQILMVGGCIADDDDTEALEEAMAVPLVREGGPRSPGSRAAREND